MRAGIETVYGSYGCGMGDSLERPDFQEGLEELDRRYFLIQVDSQFHLTILFIALQLCMCPVSPPRAVQNYEIELLNCY